MGDYEIVIYRYIHGNFGLDEHWCAFGDGATSYFTYDVDSFYACFDFEAVDQEDWLDR